MPTTTRPNKGDPNTTAHLARGRIVIITVAAIIGAGILGACRKAAPPTSQPTGPTGPNVLLLTVDTLRADYLSRNGYDRPTTPYLDKLIAEGLYFSRAYTPLPRTTQALASTLTGSYPHKTNVRRLWDTLSPNVVPLAELARQHGYRTIAVVSNFILTPERRLDRGFEIYDQQPDSRDAAATTADTIKYLELLHPSERVFLWVHYIDPHVPYYPPPQYAESFDPGYTGRYRLHFGDQKGGIGNQAYPSDLPKRVAVHQNNLPDEVNAHIRRLYAADIRQADDAIATLVPWIRANIPGDWIILFTSDHGESLGEHDYFYDHGDYVYNATLHVPLAIVLPPEHPLRRTGEDATLASLIDVTPTLAELMDIPVPADIARQIEGRSLVPRLRGEQLPPRPVFAECGHSFFPTLMRRRVNFDIAGRFRTVIDDNWKLIFTPEQSPQLSYELYDISADPNETTNRYDPDAPQVATLRAALRTWMGTATAAEKAQGPSAEDVEALRSLGYME